MTIGEQKNLGHIVLKKADIILKRGTGAISEGIEAVTHSKFSHAALVVDPDKNLLIDAVLLEKLEKFEIIPDLPSIRRSSRKSCSPFLIEEIAPLI